MQNNSLKYIYSVYNVYLSTVVIVYSYTDAGEAKSIVQDQTIIQRTS